MRVVFVLTVCILTGLGAHSQIVVDCVAKKVTSQPATVEKRVSVSVRIDNVNDMMFTYSVSSQWNYYLAITILWVASQCGQNLIQEIRQLNENPALIAMAHPQRSLSLDASIVDELQREASNEIQ